MGSTSLPTLTKPMVSLFTPPPSCSSHWTYEGSTANQIPGGILLQDAQGDHLDQNCLPAGFQAWGRGVSTIQIFSPGACPVGYATIGENLDANTATTTATCCPSHFHFTSSANYFGCTSTYPADAGATTIFVEGKSGFTSSLDGTTSLFTNISGEHLMWAQPITIAFQNKDLSLFTTPSTTSSPTSKSTSKTSKATSSSSSSSSSNLSSGAIAGIVIGAVAFLGLLIGAVIFFRRKWQSKSSSLTAGEKQASEKGLMEDHRGRASVNDTGFVGQRAMDAESAQHGTDQQQTNQLRSEIHGNSISQLSNHADRRHELPSS